LSKIFNPLEPQLKKLYNLILFGFKKCGKTHYGQRLASQLKYDFIDTDHLIEKELRLTCREIVKIHGENHFRSLEKKAIATLQIKKNTILSVGGGAILDPENAEALKKIGTLVYLEVDKETLKHRIFNSQHLPSYLDEADPLNSFEKMYRERKPIYEKTKAIKVNIEGKNEDEVLALLKNMV
jgi:shikimate kinase